MSEANEGARAIDLAPGSGDPSGGGLSAVLKVRDDLRLVLVGLGGGGVNVTRAVARRRLPHLETVAINCDPRVQSFEEFDRLLYLGPENAEATGTGGSPLVGGMLARAAEPRLRSIFEDAPFVTIVASLGGGSGSGLVLPILELASRYAHHVTAFVIKPFACEGDRRGIAERTIGRIHFLEQFNDRASRGQARLEVLDNQALVPRLGNRSFSFVPAYWANVVGRYVEDYLVTTEAEIASVTALEATKVAQRAAPEPAMAPALELPPLAAGLTAPPAMDSPKPLEAELTFEVVGAGPLPRPAP